MKIFYLCLVAIAAASVFLRPDHCAGYTEPHRRRGDQGTAIRLGTSRPRELVRTRVSKPQRNPGSSSAVTISLRRSRRRVPFPNASIRLDGCALSPRGLQQRGLHALDGSLGVFAAPIRRRLFQTGRDADRATVRRGYRHSADGLNFVSAAPGDFISSSSGRATRRCDLCIPAQRRRLEAACPARAHDPTIHREQQRDESGHERRWKHRRARHAELLPRGIRQTKR